MKIRFNNPLIRRLAIIAVFAICWSALPMAVALQYAASQWHTVAMAVTAIAIKLKEAYLEQKRLECFTIKNHAHSNQVNPQPTISYDSKQTSTISVSDVTLQVPTSIQHLRTTQSAQSTSNTTTHGTKREAALEPAVGSLVKIPDSLVAQERMLWTKSMSLASSDKDNAHLAPQSQLPILSGDTLLAQSLHQVTLPGQTRPVSHSQTHLSMTLTSRQMTSYTKDVYKNLAALSRIGQSTESRELFKQQYAQFQSDLYACLNAKDTAGIFNALINLSDAESNYYQLADVPFLRERMIKAANEIQHVLLNQEGALVPGWSEQNNVQIARVIAEFSTPLNCTYADFKQIVQQMVENNIPGAFGLQRELETQGRQRLIFRLIDFFTNGKNYSSRSAVFKNHPVTKAAIELKKACLESRWEDAEDIVSDFSHATRSRHDDSSKLLSRLFNELAFENGIFKKYQHHPSYQYLINSPQAIHQSGEINKVLADQYRLKEAFLEQLGIARPSMLVDQLAYELATQFYDPLAVNRILSDLSADHPDQKVREAFHAFFDSRGIYKLAQIAHADKALSIPKGLALCKHTSARNLFNILTHIDTPTALAAEEITRAVEYVNLACSEHPRAQDYLVLAQAIANAHISADADKTILACGDFSLLNKNNEQIVLQDALVRTAAELCTSLSHTTNEADRAELKSALLALEATRNAATASTVDKVIQKSFHQTVLLPKLEKLNVIVPGIMAGSIILKELYTNTESDEEQGAKLVLLKGDHHQKPQRNTTPPNNSDDNDPEKPKDRKVNTLTKKEFFEQVKNDYEHWRDGIYKRKKGANGLSKHAEYLEWDKLHNEVEGYNKKGKHIGAFDPLTQAIYKSAVEGRKL